MDKWTLKIMLYFAVGEAGFLMGLGWLCLQYLHGWPAFGGML